MGTTALLFKIVVTPRNKYFFIFPVLIVHMHCYSMLPERSRDHRWQVLTESLIHVCCSAFMKQKSTFMHINILDELIGFPFHAQYNFKLKLIMKMRLEILIHYAKIRVYMVHGIPRVYICD